MIAVVFWIGIIVFGFPGIPETRVLFAGQNVTQSACMEELQTKAMVWFREHMEPMGLVARLGYCVPVSPAMIVPLVEDGDV
jgi:hypothetical protein